MHIEPEYKIAVNPIDTDNENSVILYNNFIEHSNFLTLNMFLRLKHNIKKYIIYFVVEYSGMRQNYFFSIDDVLWFRFGDKDKGLKNMYKYASDLPKDLYWRDKTAMFVVTAEILETIINGINLKVIVPIAGEQFIFSLTDQTLNGIKEFYTKHVLPAAEIYDFGDL